MYLGIRELEGIATPCSITLHVFLMLFPATIHVLTLVEGRGKGARRRRGRLPVLLWLLGLLVGS